MLKILLIFPFTVCRNVELLKLSFVLDQSRFKILNRSSALKTTEEAKKNETRAVEVEKSSVALKKSLEEELEAKVS